MEPFVTIITPTYNLLENNLADDFNLLISLLDLQTYPNIEHLVIDNASNDGTIEMLKNYKNLGFLSFIPNAIQENLMHITKGLCAQKGNM